MWSAQCTSIKLLILDAEGISFTSAQVEENDKDTTLLDVQPPQLKFACECDDDKNIYSEVTIMK